MDAAMLASMIDQTLLNPKAGMSEAAAWMEANREQGFAALCVSPFLVPLATQHLAGSSTRVCSVVGFPLGYSLTETKAEEAVHLVELGCTEADMVINIAALLEGEDATSRDESLRSWTPSPRARRRGDREGDPRDRVSRRDAHRPSLWARRFRRSSLREDLHRIRPARRFGARR